MWPIARNRGSNKGRQHRPELLVEAANVLGSAIVRAMIFEPNVGKMSKSTPNRSSMSAWKDTCLNSSWIGNIRFRGMRSDDLDDIVRRAAGYLLSS